jgi:hypothetical protein
MPSPDPVECTVVVVCGPWVVVVEVVVVDDARGGLLVI